MRILLVGAGGVGDAIAKIAATREFYELIVVSDYDLNRAERTVAILTLWLMPWSQNSCQRFSQVLSLQV
jgi:shikimate 5-dehydrogenase